MNWWTLPGPRSFIDAVIEDIREGKSVFICLPEFCPVRVSTCVQEGIQDDLGWISTSAEPDASPLDFLYDLVAADADPRQLRSVATLAALEGFHNKAIWLDEIPAPAWDAWLQFFTEYERVSRSIPESRRSCFAVRMSGHSATLPIPAAAGLSVRRWDGWLKRHDMRLYSAGQVQERRTGLETDLATAIVTVLGGWDPELCGYLAGFELPELLRPSDLLRKFAENRGWKLGEAVLDEQAWQRGLWQTYLGKHQAHTCFAVVLNGS